MENNEPLQVIETSIMGTRKANSKLYLIIWQRLCNSGIHMGWASNETEALKRYGWSTKICKHTITEINPDNLPVTAGVRG